MEIHLMALHDCLPKDEEARIEDRESAYVEKAVVGFTIEQEGNISLSQSAAQKNRFLKKLYLDHQECVG